MSHSKIDVGVLGATGMVGQQFIARLAEHPWFNARWLAASERSDGKSYADAAPWRLATPMPDACRETRLEACVPGRGPKVVFSALDAKAADELEHQFAAAGHIVLSNARSHRMDPLVPLLIPEINADHLCLLAEQRKVKGWTGAIVTNPNCATIVLAMALAPLRQFDLRRVVVTTMQAVSGAGYPGVRVARHPRQHHSVHRRRRRRKDRDSRRSRFSAAMAAERRTRRSSARRSIACR